MSVELSSTQGQKVYEVQTEPYTVDTEYGFARVMRVSPPPIWYDQHDGDAPEAVFSPGWGERYSTTKAFGECLARAGFITTLYEYPDMKRTRFRPSDAQRIRSSVTDDVLDTVTGKKVIVAHSEGAFQGIHAAATRNDIKATLLAAPGGLIGPLTPLELLMSGLAEGVDAAKGNRTNVLGAAALIKALASLAVDVGGRPQVHAAEVVSIAATDARPELVKALRRGAKIGLIACRFDRIFPAERIEAHLAGVEDLLEVYEVLNTNHFNFLMQEIVRAELIRVLHELVSGLPNDSQHWAKPDYDGLHFLR